MRTEHIKVNIPESLDDYINGNGEGVWVLVNKQVKTRYDENASNLTFDGTLDNDSWNWSLRAGHNIKVELRADKRPVVPYEWLCENHYRIKG